MFAVTYYLVLQFKLPMLINMKPLKGLLSNTINQLRLVTRVEVIKWDLLAQFECKPFRMISNLDGIGCVSI